ncbi:hypothetical protein K0M31_005469 [Melipona bicolor]|uniref:Uncharacterized protein n=1 Tax=Melipona bicolor TaxID=60889 RepID=A0AA40FVU3_9HYME|nr:hypothetical protein K0M31_005469 [Melipona bicolor]
MGKSNQLKRQDDLSKFKTKALFSSTVGSRPRQGSNANIGNVLIVSDQGTFRSTIHSAKVEHRENIVEALPIIGSVHRIQNRDASVGVAFESSSNRRAAHLWKFNETKKKVDAFE